MEQLLWKTVCWFLKTVNTERPYDPDMSKVRAGTQMGICTPVLPAAMVSHDSQSGMSPRVHQQVNG